VVTLAGGCRPAPAEDDHTVAPTTGNVAQGDIMERRYARQLQVCGLGGPLVMRADLPAPLSRASITPLRGLPGPASELSQKDNSAKAEHVS
jgi:hypothetical protein